MFEAVVLGIAIGAFGTLFLLVGVVALLVRWTGESIRKVLG